MPSSRCPPPSPTLGPSLGPGLRLSLTLTLSRYGLPLPTSFVQLRGASFGAAWLTAAMRAAGSLADSCAVRRIAELYELPLEGDDAQGGAGHKAILTVKYDGPAEALEGLHARLFVKMPWR